MKVILMKNNNNVGNVGGHNTNVEIHARARSPAARAARQVRRRRAARRSRHVDPLPQARRRALPGAAAQHADTRAAGAHQRGRHRDPARPAGGGVSRHDRRPPVGRHRGARHRRRASGSASCSSTSSRCSSGGFPPRASAGPRTTSCRRSPSPRSSWRA